MNPQTQPAKDANNIDKSLKIIQKLPHCLCFFLRGFTWKNTLKSNKSTETDVEIWAPIFNTQKVIALIKAITFCNISKMLSSLQTLVFVDEEGDGRGGVNAALSILRLVSRFQEVFFAPPFHIPVVDSGHAWGEEPVKEQHREGGRRTDWQTDGHFDCQSQQGTERLFIISRCNFWPSNGKYLSFSTFVPCHTSLLSD